MTSPCWRQNDHWCGQFLFFHSPVLFSLPDTLLRATQSSTVSLTLRLFSSLSCATFSFVYCVAGPSSWCSPTWCWRRLVSRFCLSLFWSRWSEWPSRKRVWYSLNGKGVNCRIQWIRDHVPRRGNSCEGEAVSEMSSTTLRRVFWPVTAARGRNAPGWIVGWMNSDNDYFVFAILDEESIKVQKQV